MGVLGPAGDGEDAGEVAADGDRVGVVGAELRGAHLPYACGLLFGACQVTGVARAPAAIRRVADLLSEPLCDRATIGIITPIMPTRPPASGEGQRNKATLLPLSRALAGPVARWAVSPPQARRFAVPDHGVATNNPVVDRDLGVWLPSA
jgi:hypothetical protein